MKKILFTTLSLLLLAFYGNAQNCTPDPNIPPDLVGVYPLAEVYLPCDTIIPVDAVANINCPYEYTFTTFVPNTLQSGATTFIINNVVISSVDGLPSGLTYVCEPSNCVFPSGQSGCMKIVGTPDATNALGNYPMTVHATVNVGGFIPFALDVTFPPADPNDNPFSLPECPYTIVLEADNCTPPACEIPASTNVEMTTATTAQFSWDAVPDATFYQVKYRLKGTTAWSTVGSGSTQRSVPNLSTKKYYQYKVRAQCGTEWSDFSPVTLFYTSACDAPTGVATTFTDLTRMRVRWDNNPDEIKAKIRYRVQGTPTWITQNSADGNNFLWVNGLPSGATIQYKVRSNCDGNDWSEYSSPLQTVTLGTTNRESQIVNEVTLSPNPAKDMLNLAFNMDDAREVNIAIYDNLGREVVSINNTYQEGDQRETLDISGLANGYYFVAIRNGNNVETQKFIKMN